MFNTSGDSDSSHLPASADPGGWLFNSSAQNDGRMTVNDL